MKTYLKHPCGKRWRKIYYSSFDIPSHFSAHVDIRQRVIQPSTKEQQHLFLSSATPRLRHRHVGKYGIKLLQPQRTFLCEQQRKWSKVIIIDEIRSSERNSIHR